MLVKHHTKFATRGIILSLGAILCVNSVVLSASVVKIASKDSPQRHRDFTERHRGDRAQPDVSVYRSLLSRQQQDEVVRVNAELVVLNATVLDKDGKFVS